VQGRVKARFFTQYSDIRLKMNITDIVDALETVTKLQGKTYEWRQDHSEEKETEKEPHKRVIGLIAQEVYTVLPEVVHEDPQTGILSVSYTELIPVLIEAFKQFLREYEEDKSATQVQLDEMKGMLEVLSGKLDRADLDYMPNLNKALLDLRLATLSFISQGAQNVKKAAFGLVIGVATGVSTGVVSVSEGVASRIHSVSQGVVNLHIPTKVGGVASGVTSKVGGVAGGMFRSKVVTRVNGVMQSKVMSGVSNRVTGVANGVSRRVSGVATGISDGVSTKVTGVTSSVKDKIFIIRRRSTVVGLEPDLPSLEEFDDFEQVTNSTM